MSLPAFWKKAAFLKIILYATIAILCRGADKSLGFPIFSTTKIISLGWLKEVKTMKS
jgi:hypothetical protein